MRWIKKLIAAAVLVVIAAIALTFISLQIDQNHQQNCESLGVTCEKGRFQLLVEDGLNWLKDQGLLH